MKIYYKVLFGMVLPILWAIVFGCAETTYEEAPTILTTIEITSLPKKMVYHKGEYFSATGLAVEAVYSDGRTIENFPFVISPPDNFRLMTEGSQEITVSAGSLTKTFSVIVEAKSVAALKITQTPGKLVYTQGETLDTAGLEVTATYTDDTTAVLSAGEYIITPENGAELSEIKEVALMVAVPGFSDTTSIFVMGITDEKGEEPDIGDYPDDSAGAEQWLYYTISDSGEAIVAGAASNCKVRHISIPEKIGEYPVTEVSPVISGLDILTDFSTAISVQVPSSVKKIGKWAFNTPTLKRIVIEDGCMEIEGWAFRGENITEIVLPTTLESIASYAFSYIALEELVIPSVKVIHTNAILSLSRLKRLVIGGSDVTIAESAVFECPRLTDVTLASLEDCRSEDFTGFGVKGYFEDVGNLNITYTGTGTRVGAYVFAGDTIMSFACSETASPIRTVGIYAFTEATIGEILATAEIIEDFAYYKTQGIVEVPPTVTAIGNSAFAGSSLKSMRIGENITYLGEGLFVDSALEKLVIAQNLPDDSAAALKCGNPISVVFEDNVTRLAARCFIENTIVSLVLPSKLEEIGDLALGGCCLNDTFQPLETFDFPTLKKIGQDFYCKIKEAVLYGGMEELNSNFKGWEIYVDRLVIKGDLPRTNFLLHAWEIVVEEGVTDLSFLGGVNTIDGQGSDARKVTLCSKLSELRPYEFYAMENLEEVVIEGGITSSVIPEGCFYQCSSLAAFEIPEGITKIGRGAFALCSSLTSLKLPSSLQSLGDIAFGETSIENIAIPEGITEIPEQCFYGCKNLASVTIPSSVTRVETSAFAYSGLSEFPFEQLEYIGQEAFFNTAFEEIRLTNLKSNLKFRTNIFAYCRKLKRVYLDTPTLGEYKNLDAEGFYNGYLFANCTSLESVILSENVTIIPCNCFYNCPTLSEITIPKSVKTIQSNAFGWCTGIRKVTYEGNTIPLVDGKDPIGYYQRLEEIVVNRSSDWKTALPEEWRTASHITITEK